MLRYLIPFFDPEIRNWALEARLLRWLTFLWLSIGLVILFSASYPVGDAEVGDGLHYFKAQLLSVWVGMLAFNIVVRVPIRYLLRIAPWTFLFFLGLIFMTRVPGMGVTVLGSARWLQLGPITIQPSELIKPFLVLQSASIFGKWNFLSWKVRINWVLIFTALLGGILLQPNLSTTALCGMTIWLIALAGGLPFTYLIATAIAGVATAGLSLRINTYQWIRVKSFLDPWADAMENGYQLVQSLLAIGSGGTWGVGFGLSQQKLFYLPIHYTDFIFSVFAEEFGFAGSVLLLLLILSYGTLALIVAMKCTHPVLRLVAMGVMIIIVGQSLLNIGVATGALPTTGLPLPLFSYGRNSVIASLFLAGLLIRVARETAEAEVIFLPKNRPLSQKSKGRSVQKWK